MVDSRRRIRLVPMFVESAIIVGSILAAFGIDAWWEDRARQATIRAYHTQLFTQMSRNRGSRGSTSSTPRPSARPDGKTLENRRR
jgi:hypothetical protein